VVLAVAFEDSGECLEAIRQGLALVFSDGDLPSLEVDHTHAVVNVRFAGLYADVGDFIYFQGETLGVVKGREFLGRFVEVEEDPVVIGKRPKMGKSALVDAIEIEHGNFKELKEAGPVEVDGTELLAHHLYESFNRALGVGHVDANDFFQHEGFALKANAWRQAAADAVLYLANAE